MICGRLNGLLARKRLHAEHQPSVGGRFNVMLMILLSPAWHASRPFDEVLSKWDIDALEYERPSMDIVALR